MAKKPARKEKSFTLKGEDLEMVITALDCHADLCDTMLNDKELSATDRGAAGFDLQHCRDLLKRMGHRGGK